MPRGDGSLPVREEAADGRQQTGDVPSSAGLVASTAPGWPRLGGCTAGLDEGADSFCEDQVRNSCAG